MMIKEAVFITSNSKIDKLPAATLPEYAFVGRSNVGKSSLINMLCARKALAKTSAKPGKTITINHFLIDNAWYLVDLPGYGYAKRSKLARDQWAVLMDAYLLKRTNLVCTFILIDSRLSPQASDLELMEWMAERQLPFVLVFTKSDKLGATNLEKAIAVYKEQLLLNWEELPEMIITSSEKARGRDELLDYIQSNNQLFKAIQAQ